MSSNWTASLEDSSKTVLAFASTIKSAQLTLPLNDVGTLNAAFDITGQDTSVIFNQLAQGAVFIRLAENGTTRFWGQLSDLQVEASDDGSVTTTFTDVMGPFGSVQCIYYRSVYQPLTNTTAFQGRPRGFKANQNTIVDALLQHRSAYEFQQNGSIIGTGFTNTFGPLVYPTRSGSATNKTRSVTSGTATVLETLKSISDLADGIEWYVTPDKTLTVATTLGTDKSSSVIFQFKAASRGNVVSASSQYLPPRNIIWVSGNDNILRRAGYDQTSVETYGEYSAVLPKTRRASETDDELASSRLRSKWRQFVTVVLEPTIGPRPWTNFYLGDRIGLDLAQGAWSYTGNQRLNQITFDFDESLVESQITTQFEVQ